MHTRTCTHIHTHMHTQLQNYIHTRVHIYIHTHMHICTHMHTCIYTHEPTHTFTKTPSHTYTIALRARSRICKHICIHTYVHTHAHIHTRIHTYIHTYTHISLDPGDDASKLTTALGGDVLPPAEGHPHRAVPPCTHCRHIAHTYILTHRTRDHVHGYRGMFARVYACIPTYLSMYIHA